MKRIALALLLLALLAPIGLAAGNLVATSIPTTGIANSPISCPRR